MCGRISQEEQKFLSEQRYWDRQNLTEIYPPRYNIGIGSPALVGLPGYKLTRMQFGIYKQLGPKKYMLFNARAEGDLNPEDSTAYMGDMGIVRKPAFKKSIAERRCVIPVSSFIEGPKVEKLSKPYKVEMADRSTMMLAAIHDTNVNGEPCFAIVTCWANELLHDVVGHHRSPVVLEPDFVEDYLDPETPIEDIMVMLRPYHSDLMHAEPISTAYKSADYTEPY